MIITLHDMGTELYEREKDFALEEHADSELNKVNEALQAMEERNIWEMPDLAEYGFPMNVLKSLPSTLF